MVRLIRVTLGLKQSHSSSSAQAKFWYYSTVEHLTPSLLWFRQTRDRKVAGSSPGRSGGRTVLSRVNFLCWLLFRYPFHPCVTAVARKRSRSFCQKCRWQVTAKHTYTLPVWLWMKWHCNLVHGWMVYTELAPKRQHFTWHQPCNNHRALPVHHFRGY